MSIRQDFDGVLLDIGGPMMPLPFEFLAEVERGFGLAAGTIDLGGPFSPLSDLLWPERNAGRVTEREYWTEWVERVQRAAGTTCALPEFFVACFRHAHTAAIRPQAATLVTDARTAGLKVGALTNELSWILPEEFLDAATAYAELDVLVDLSHSGVRKPEPQAYAMALDALGLPAERVLFVDDLPANVTGAQAAGMCGMHFDLTDVPGSFRRIRDRLALAA